MLLGHNSSKGWHFELDQTMNMLLLIHYQLFSVKLQYKQMVHDWQVHEYHECKQCEQLSRSLYLNIGINFKTWFSLIVFSHYDVNFDLYSTFLFVSFHHMWPCITNLLDPDQFGFIANLETLCCELQKDVSFDFTSHCEIK